MISWLTVVVTICFVAMIYFMVKGIKLAFSSKELPEPSEGDYEVEILGKFKDGRLLVVMSPKGARHEDA